MKFQFRVSSPLKVLRTIFLLPWLAAMFVLPAHAAPLDPELVAQLNADGNAAKKAAIIKFALLASPEATLLLESLANDSLFLAGETGEIILRMEGERAFDAATGEEVTPVPEDMDQLYPNNRVRRMLYTSLSVLKLFAPDRDVRLEAAIKIEDSGADAAFLPVLDKVLKEETDSEIKQIVTLIRAMIGLNSKDPAFRLSAVKDLGESDNPDIK